MAAHCTVRPRLLTGQKHKSWGMLPQRLSFFWPLSLVSNLPQIGREGDPRPASLGNDRIGSYLRRHAPAEFSWRLRMPWKDGSLGQLFHEAVAGRLGDRCGGEVAVAPASPPICVPGTMLR